MGYHQHFRKNHAIQIWIKKELNFTLLRVIWLFIT